MVEKFSNFHTVLYAHKNYDAFTCRHSIILLLFTFLINKFIFVKILMIFWWNWKKNCDKNKKWQNYQEDRAQGGDLVQELPKISKAGWSQWGMETILIPLLNWSRTPGVPGGVEIYPRLSLLETKSSLPDILF